MERARIRRKRQQFQTQLDIQSRELREAIAAQLSCNPKHASLHARLVLKAQYQLGELCTEYNEFGLAIVYFQQVLTNLENEELPQDEDEELTTLKTNLLNWLAVTHFRAGKHNEAVAFLLQAKQNCRDELNSTDTNGPRVDKLLTANYALFLHAKDNIVDAETAAQLVIDEGEADPNEEPENDMRARSTAFMLLASIYKAKGDAQRALNYAERAVVLADRVRDPRLISRAHNNLGIYCLEQSDLGRAFSLFASAYRATQQTKDFEQQATVKYHLGIALSYLGRNLNGKQEISDDEEDEDGPEEIQQHRAVQNPKLSEHGESKPNSLSTGDEVVIETSPDTVTPPTKTPKDLFLESENLTDALPEPDNSLRVLTQSSRGEEEYYAGEFHTAEAEFTIALGQLKEFTGIDIDDETFNAKTEVDTVASNDADVVNTEAIEVSLPAIEPELAKLHGLLLSYIGCTQLVEGKFSFAELSHKRDLALSLRQEDLHAQHRALRNLAIVYNSTQRYVEAIPLWREALELTVVLDLKGEQLMAYSGLGSALRELLMVEGPNAAEAAGLNSGSEAMQPLQVFLKQRELAEDIGDLHQQILAQRHIVSVYESPISKPQSESEATEVLESRLSECDTLVKLCEKCQNLQYRADAYRSLANALTSQIVRLRARASSAGASANYGLADAIALLSQKRNSVCASYEDANIALSTAATLMFQDIYDEGTDDEAKGSKPKPDERHARPPLTRLEILQRR
ncbi:Zinc ion binding protein [Phytophthora megakarya]|uniref:Zinc ion binding protein n=1 Tax=Phytophthora megakarya TaxID=4795 RepID=A0A225X2Y5_9STRA|nr:Zinc ion binding protein [Phytophthora megakarya]